MGIWPNGKPPSVNVEKTKCLPFYRGRFDNVPVFFYKQRYIENVKKFKYLGIVFTTQLSVTMSMGVASMEGDEDSPEKMLKRADVALYSAKKDGRNRVVTEVAA